MYSIVNGLYLDGRPLMQSLSQDGRSKRPIANTGENRYNCYNCDVDFCSICALDQKRRLELAHRHWLTAESLVEGDEEEEVEVWADYIFRNLDRF